MEAGRCGGALALVSSEIRRLGLDGYPSKLRASVSPPVFGGWCCPRVLWLQTQRIEEFTGKPLGKCSLFHRGELKLLIFEMYNMRLT